MYFSSESEKGLNQDKIKDIAINASDKVYEQDDLGPIQSIKNSLTFVLTQVTQVAQFLQDNEYEISTANKNEEKVLILFIMDNVMTCDVSAHSPNSHQGRNC